MLVAIAGTSAAAPTDMATEKAIRDDVERASSAAVIAFDAGNVARATHHLAEALAAYRRAIELAPSLDHPHRRACNVLAELGRKDEAIVECETALKLDPASPFDKFAVAALLSQRKGGQDRERALALANEAAAQRPNDIATRALACTLAIQTKLDAESTECIERLYDIDPKSAVTNYLGALNAIMHGGFSGAKQRLEVAHAAGLDDKQYREILDLIAQAERDRAAGPTGGLSAAVFLWIALGIAGPWLLGLTILLVAGHTGRRGLVWLGTYLYLSIPVVLVTGALGGIGAILVLFSTNRIPIVITVVIVLVVIGAIASMVRRLTTRHEPALPGQHVEFESQPRLWALLDEVAAAAGGDDLDAVYLAPGAELAILERESVWGALRGRQPECWLVIGIGLFEGMTQLQLRSLLAHEYGHSAGGERLFGVRRAVVDQCNGLRRAGLVALDPVWWLLLAFHRIFTGVSAAAARRQEQLADRSAVEAYGTAAFVGAQRHVATFAARFPLAITAAVAGAVKASTPLSDLYQPPPAVNEEALAKAVLAKLTEVPGDGHASAHERIAAAEALAVTRDAKPGDDDPVWALLDDRVELERAMTAVIADRLAAKGFTLKPPALS